MIRRTEWVAECMFAKQNDPCSLQYTSQTNLVSIWMLQTLLAQKLRAPFCTAAIFCLVATTQASETSSWIQWGTASEGSPALWWWSWKLDYTRVWFIPPDNSLWDYIQENGTGPLEESPKHQRAWGIVYYYFHNFLHGTGISGFARNSSYNF